MGIFIISIAAACVVSILYAQRLTGQFTFVILMPYQNGVLYRRGRPAREVGPGRHGVWAGIEKIMFIDVRPVSFTYENRAVTLRDGVTAIYGLTGSAEIRDVRKAIYAANNANHLAAFAVLSSARFVFSQYTAESLKLKKDQIVSEIQQRAKVRLNGSGIELLSFKLTQLGIAAPPPAAPPAAVPTTPPSLPS